MYQQVAPIESYVQQQQQQPQQQQQQQQQQNLFAANKQPYKYTSVSVSILLTSYTP